MIEKKPETTANNKSFSALRKKAEEILLSRDPLKIQQEGEAGVLLDELEVYELELQMQQEELKRSQELLELERAKFARLFDAAPVAYIVVDDIGLIEAFNQRASSILEPIVSGGILGKNFSSFISEDSHNTYYSLLHEIIHNDFQAYREIKMLSTTGSDLFLQIDATCNEIPSTGKRNYFITLTDITPIRTAQDSLQESAQRFTHTLQASQTGTWMVNLFNRRIYFDEYAAQILQLDAKHASIPIAQLAQLVVEEDRHKLDVLFVKYDPLTEIDFELRCLSGNQEVRTLLIKGKQVQLPNDKDYLSGVLVDITARTRYQAEEEQKKKIQERLIRKKFLEAQEKERERISAILHDSVCQTLFGIRFNLSHLRLANSNIASIANVQKLIDQAIEELRSLSHELSPSLLRDFGFIAGLDDMVKRLASFGFDIKTSISKKADKLPSEMQLYIFRIIQELLNNVIQHSGSTKAEVSLLIDNQTISLCVRDHGSGMQQDLEELAKGGSGLRSVINRVGLLSGKMEMNYDKGTFLRIYIPQPAKKLTYGK